jgi:hypothetical protein
MLLLVACAADPGAPAPTPDDAGVPAETGEAPVADVDTIYDPDRVWEIAVTVDPQNWEYLREESRSIGELFDGDCLADPFESPYEWYPADIAIDGVAVGEVGLRKKGFLGSDDPDRPALKVDFDRYTDGLVWNGARKLTLNNARQDPSRLHTCLAYASFAAMGLEASRCNFARVVVNGEDLGIYANVEPVDEDFLARRGHDAVGSLYEGTISDFRDGWTGTFDPKTDASDDADIAAVTTAVGAGDDEVVAALEEVVDLDQYLAFWAAEVITGHWDGYDGNTNNFFVWGDPSDGRLRFLPWGVDAAFDAEEPFGSGQPVSIVANNALSGRLAGHDEGRARYEAALRERLALWTEVDWEAEVDRMDALVGDLADPDGSGGYAEEVAAVREVVAGRAAAIEAELAEGLPTWDAELRDVPCFTAHGTIDVEFSTDWGTYDSRSPLRYGEAGLSLVWEGTEYTAEGGAVAGDDPDYAGYGDLVVGARLDAAYVVPFVQFDLDILCAGTEELDWRQATGGVYYADESTGGDYRLLAYIEGDLTFDEASAEAGAPIVGRITGDLVTFGW